LEPDLNCRIIRRTSFDYLVISRHSFGALTDYSAPDGKSKVTAAASIISDLSRPLEINTTDSLYLGQKYTALPPIASIESLFLFKAPRVFLNVILHPLRKAYESSIQNNFSRQANQLC
jgi:hypothetical protein